MPACGPLRTFALAACRCLGRGPEGGIPPGLSRRRPRLREGALRCSRLARAAAIGLGTAERGAHLTAFSPARPMRGAAPRSLRCSPAPMRPAGHPPAGLEPPVPRVGLPCGTRSEAAGGGPGSEWAPPAAQRSARDARRLASERRRRVSWRRVQRCPRPASQPPSRAQRADPCPTAAGRLSPAVDVGRTAADRRTADRIVAAASRSQPCRSH